jgi:hypothetical protein
VGGIRSGPDGGAGRESGKTISPEGAKRVENASEWALKRLLTALATQEAITGSPASPRRLTAGWRPEGRRSFEPDVVHERCPAKLREIAILSPSQAG